MDTVDCNWYTFYPNNDLCMLYNECEFIPADNGALTGQRECGDSPPSGSTQFPPSDDTESKRKLVK